MGSLLKGEGGSKSVPRLAEEKGVREGQVHLMSCLGKKRRGGPKKRQWCKAEVGGILTRCSLVIPPGFQAAPEEKGDGGKKEKH